MAGGFGGGINFAARPVEGAVAEASRFDADSKAPSPSQSSSAPEPRVRSQFPETWLWVDKTVELITILSSQFHVFSASGKLTYTVNAPDQITSYVITAFGINSDSGLGIVQEPVKLKIFQPFFVRLNTPYSVKRGEKLALQVLVFNYDSKPQQVTLTLAHNATAGFDFVKADGSLLAVADQVKNYNVRQVSVSFEFSLSDNNFAQVPSGGAQSVSFPIAPNKIGDLPLDIIAKGTTTSDRIQDVLKVEPEGYRVDRNVPLLIDLSSGKTFTKNITLDYPKTAVEGSPRGMVNVAGDIMGPVLANLDKLIQMPTGCGEQNMLGFVPDIVALNYLVATNRNDPVLKDKAVGYLKEGYQREMTYRHKDNSFSAFGQSDPHGSTWLTAFVVRSFKQAQRHVDISQKVIDQSIEFLKVRFLGVKL